MRRHRVAPVWTVALLGSALLLLSAGPAAATTSTWPTYHLDPARSGNDTGEPGFGSLTPAWDSGALDGLIVGEPLVEGGTAIVATEADTLWAFDTLTGQLEWRTPLGTPRTSTFICPDFNPMGVSMLYFDGNSIYAVDEVQTRAGHYEFHLAKVDAASGELLYNRNITPTGMDTSLQKQRGALAASNGNIVVTWGGLENDCGNFHGYVETVSESSGAVVAQWHDTPDDNAGGIWAPSGPAVDAAGNIYITTGNGTSTSAYDQGDSLLEFAPDLSSYHHFAPGPPQPWTSLNSSDTDLGSVGPTLLSNGTVFVIGKGGRGYLLTQNALPDKHDPAASGGENYSAQVCPHMHDAAFSGLAVSGNRVYVPCADGIAAVDVDSTTHFSFAWQQRSGGGAAPILAGGILWTGSMFGGTTLYGLDPGSGAIRERLALPDTTAHFATASAGDGRLFIGAGRYLAAYVPRGTPAPPSGGYILDGWGGIHNYGGASGVASTDSFWPGWDIARGLVMRPNRASGFVLDGLGGVHSFGGAPPVRPTAYWPGWDIARGIALNPCDTNGNSGYVLDGLGGIHPFGGAPDTAGGPYWPRWDIARAIALNPCTNNAVSGYVLDGWGGVHPFHQVNTPAPALPHDTNYWPGWDIARSMVLTSPGNGYLLDGWGGVHAFGSNPDVIGTSFSQGHDISRSLTYSASMGGGYVLDGFGVLHPWWKNGGEEIASPWNPSRWGWEIARTAVQ